jgi:hypothetical protein
MLYRHDITEILLKVALNTINQVKSYQIFIESFFHRTLQLQICLECIFHLTLNTGENNGTVASALVLSHIELTY